jgi:hypothetical protein
MDRYAIIKKPEILSVNNILFNSKSLFLCLGTSFYVVLNVKVRKQADQDDEIDGMSDVNSLVSIAGRLQSDINVDQHCSQLYLKQEGRKEMCI